MKTMGRSIIVTGGFGALGRVVAESFCALGDQVTRIDRASAATDGLNHVSDIAGIDLTDAAAVGRAVAEVAERQGGLDILVNIAGGFTWRTVEESEMADWEGMFSINLLTNVVITRAALPLLKASKAGRIINLGANAAHKAAAGMAPYAAAKAGVHRLTEALAEELGGTAVTANAVLPTIIDTPANRAAMPDADPGHWVTPKAIADVILFLASPAARSVNGALIPVSGSSQ